MTADEAALELTVPFRVRFDESGPDGRIRTSIALRFAQDAAWQHAEALGIGRSWYAERSLDWLVRAAQVRILAPITTGDRLLVTTQVVGFRRVWARRRTDVRTLDARPVATIETDWVMVDSARAAPTRIPADIIARFASASGRFEPHRVALPPTPPLATRMPVAIRRADLDPLGHVNNGTYLDWAEDAVEQAVGPDAIEWLPRTWTLEYVASAGPGAPVVVAAWVDRDRSGGGSVRVEHAGLEQLRARIEAS
jgi:medium-chain acyl-[acyl-carrier-protein] hydrolase